MSNLNLRHRADIIKTTFDLPSFSAVTLRSYYLRYGVQYKRPDYKFWKSQVEERSLREKQQEFVMELGTMIKD